MILHQLYKGIPVLALGDDGANIVYVSTPTVALMHDQATELHFVYKDKLRYSCPI